MFDSAGYAGFVLLGSGLMLLILDRQHYKTVKMKKEQRLSIGLGITLLVLSVAAFLADFTIFRA
ncbi:CLC_0170 family protein [Paenibacillus sp. JCM 10914]|uniref:CLC_0170 family protein n=1 Tax=Paenibacillus sp. JCM 10914 TaxID=1236974 RepID=UPI00351C0802